MSTPHLFIFFSFSFSKGVVVFGLIYQEPLKYNDYMYPSWAEWMGWALALSSILMIPMFMILQLFQAPGTLKEVKIKYSFIEYYYLEFNFHFVSLENCLQYYTGGRT